ncbi:AmmeMemoRadiSam system protein B, partial [bacterium]|nr:AmmeMemoRadiSam system protein B [bacterium]
MRVRKEAVAGSFYPADASALRKDIEQRLGRVQEETSGYVIGLLSPHAGYMFSGDVASSAFRQIQGVQYEAAVVISPSHRVPFGFSAVLPDGGYHTPLGTMNVDTELANSIIEAGQLLEASDKGHTGTGGSDEHALEVLLPFLQVAVREDLPIVPVVMGRQSLEHARDLGEAIAKAAGNRRVLVVASSDLSHFHTDDEARVLDRHFVEAVAAFDERELMERVKQGATEACGAAPAAAMMHAARLLGATKAEVLQYATSADSPHGSTDRVVGYL